MQDYIFCVLVTRGKQYIIFLTQIWRWLVFENYTRSGEDRIESQKQRGYYEI